MFQSGLNMLHPESELPFCQIFLGENSVGRDKRITRRDMMNYTGRQTKARPQHRLYVMPGTFVICKVLGIFKVFNWRIGNRYRKSGTTHTRSRYGQALRMSLTGKNF